MKRLVESFEEFTGNSNSLTVEVIKNLMNQYGETKAVPATEAITAIEQSANFEDGNFDPIEDGMSNDEYKDMVARIISKLGELSTVRMVDGSFDTALGQTIFEDHGEAEMNTHGGGAHVSGQNAEFTYYKVEGVNQQPALIVMGGSTVGDHYSSTSYAVFLTNELYNAITSGGGSGMQSDEHIDIVDGQ